jgi:putative flippase GtrA
LKFNAVGIAGIGVQLLVLTAFRSGLGLNYMMATFLAVETAVFHNFFWHERWTWAERTRVHVSARQVLRRLIRFNMANGLVSIIGNLSLMWVFVDQFRLHYIPANILAVLICSIVNFILSDRLVFKIN